MKCSLMTDVNGGRIEDGNSAKLREEEAWGRICGSEIVHLGASASTHLEGPISWDGVALTARTAGTEGPGYWSCPSLPR